MQKIKGLSSILVILIIVLVLTVVVFFVFSVIGGKPPLPLKETDQITSVGSELSKGDEIGDIEVDLDSTSLDDVDRDLNDVLKEIDTQ